MGGFNRAPSLGFEPEPTDVATASSMLQKTADFHNDISELRTLDLQSPKTRFSENTTHHKGFTATTRNGFVVIFTPRYDQARGYPNVNVIEVFSPKPIRRPAMTEMPREINGKTVYMFAYYHEQLDGERYGPPHVCTRIERTLFSWPPKDE